MFIHSPLTLLIEKSCQSCGIDIFIGVGLSALLVSTNWAMREPLLREASGKTGSTLESKLYFAVTDYQCVTDGRLIH